MNHIGTLPAEIIIYILNSANDLQTLMGLLCANKTLYDFRNEKSIYRQFYCGIEARFLALNGAPEDSLMNIVKYDLLNKITYIYIAAHGVKLGDYSLRYLYNTSMNKIIKNGLFCQSLMHDINICESNGRFVKTKKFNKISKMSVREFALDGFNCIIHKRFYTATKVIVYIMVGNLDKKRPCINKFKVNNLSCIAKYVSV